MSLAAALQECFSPTKVKSDFDWRMASVNQDLMVVQGEMSQLVQEVAHFTFAARCQDKISLRLIQANGIHQLAWQFHEVRGSRWANGRHAAMQVVMPLEAVDEAKRVKINQAIAFDVEGIFMRGMRTHERSRISLNYRAKALSYIKSLIESQVKFRALTL